MEIFLLICILIVVCNINFILKNDKNKNENENKIEKYDEKYFKNAFTTLKSEEEIEKEKEMQERKEWKPNKQLFVSKEIKEQIFG